MNPLSRLLGAKKSPTERSFSDLSVKEQDEILAAERADRIKFHATSVRNGPVKWNYQTVGQQRRAEARAKKTHQRKANKRRRSQFMDRRLDVAILRSKLQHLGAIPFATDYESTPLSRARAAVWIVRHYGPLDPKGVPIMQADTLEVATERAHQTLLELTGSKKSMAEYYAAHLGS